MSEKQTDFLATIGNVYSDGATLIFDGQTQPTTKRYKLNKSVTFSSGQRVKVVKISGTYIVEYPVAAQSGGTNPPASGGEDGSLDLMGDELTADGIRNALGYTPADEADVGNTTELQTADTSSLVAAVNEVNQKVNDGGGIATPINGFFTLSVDENGDLWVYCEDDLALDFEYDTETGDLYVVQEQ